VISVIANIVPDKLKKLVSLALAGDYVGARVVHNELFKLSRVMFVESNPIPVKTAMGLLGMCSCVTRVRLAF
jgi:4-hydroxy-tetrahydrodipicolinate synthase